MDAEAVSVEGNGLLVTKEEDNGKHYYFSKTENLVVHYSLCIGSYPDWLQAK